MATELIEWAKQNGDIMNNRTMFDSDIYNGLVNGNIVNPDDKSLRAIELNMKQYTFVPHVSTMDTFYLQWQYEWLRDNKEIWEKLEGKKFIADMYMKIIRGQEMTMNQSSALTRTIMKFCTDEQREKYLKDKEEAMTVAAPGSNLSKTSPSKTEKIENLDYAILVNRFLAKNKRKFEEFIEEEKSKLTGNPKPPKAPKVPKAPKAPKVPKVQKTPPLLWEPMIPGKN